jgi:probable O-glycosylation ligase (exosortase A-associated)
VKQLVVLLAGMLFFSARALREPFYGALLYYGLAMLRPQFTWRMHLPAGIRWSLIAALTTIGATLLHLPSLGQPRVRGRFFALALGFAGLVYLSYYTAQYREVARFTTWEYTKIFIMMTVTGMVLRRPAHLLYLVLAMVLCTGFIAYEINTLYLAHRTVHMLKRGWSGLDNNGIAMALSMIVPACYCLFVGEKRWWRWAYMLLLFGTLHAIMLSYSRGGMVSTIIGGGGAVIAVTRKRAQLLWLLPLFAVAIPYMAGDEIRERFFSISEHERDASAQSRFDSWEAGIEIAMDYPLFGVGPRNSNLYTHSYGADLEGRTIHSLYIQLLADSGIFATAVYVVLLGSALWWFRVSALRVRPDPEEEDEEGGNLPARQRLYGVCQAGFWSLATFAFASIFLSSEIFEAPYMLMAAAAFAPAAVDDVLEESAQTPRPDSLERQGPLPKPRPAPKPKRRRRRTSEKSAGIASR